MRILRNLACCLVVAGLLSGCATPLGQQYGLIGGAAGAAAGAVLGGTRGAIVGGAAGAVGGGLLGDQIELDRQRSHQPAPIYRPQYPPNYPHQGGYVQPCRQVREPVFNRFGEVVGYRQVCR